MSESLKKIILFVLLALVVSYLASWAFTKYMYVKTKKIHDVKELKQINYLVLGDSQAVRGVDVRELDRAFNYADLGDSVIMSYYKLKDLIAEGKQIDTVILTASLGYFGEFKADKFTRLYLWTEIIDWWELAEIQGKHVHWLKKYLQAKFLAYKSLRKIFFRRHFSKVKEKLPYYDGFKPKPAGQFQDVTIRAKKYFKHQKHFDESLWVYLKKLLDLAMENDIDVHILRMPVTEAYYKKTMQYLKTDDLPEQIARLQVEYSNLSFQDELKRFFGKKEMFFDDIHLNADGATVITVNAT